MSKNLKPTIGISTSFTGKYQASKLIARFLELLDVQVIKSTRTKPSIIEAGTTLSSADFCLPIRVYVGHMYQLINENPNLDYLLVPIIKGEHPSSSTCAKYRDLDGVLIRSLGSITGYHLKLNQESEINTLTRLLGTERVKRLTNSVKKLPVIIAPEVESIEKEHLRRVCIDIYGEIFGLSQYTKVQYYNSSIISRRRQLSIDLAFEKAYEEVIHSKPQKYKRVLENNTKPRLAIMGRSYLVEDPALSSNIKTYFEKNGVSVITIPDVPFEELEERYTKAKGFYDYHRIGQAFIDTVMDQVDGFVLIGSFGCHPDAFQMEYFSNYLMEREKSCWTFKFDEQAGGVGFHTRFETILGFLLKNREKRLAKNIPSRIQHRFDSISVKEKDATQEPVFIWPYMGDGISLLIKEIWYQLGLNKYLYPPMPVDEETILRGNTEYTETCSPYALYMGSLRQTLDRLLNQLEVKKENNIVLKNPRRIIILMAGGKGPCTFGWYAIAGYKSIIEEYSKKLEAYGHTLEMIALDNEGRNILSFLDGFAAFADNNRLKRLIQGIGYIQNENIERFKKAKEEIQLIKLLKSIVWSGWKKLLAYEEIQNKALHVRAHEKNKGDTTKTLRSWIDILDNAHTLQEIMVVEQKAIEGLEHVEQDKDKKPRVVVVGEIYVALTPFANRGAVDNLLGQLGIEAIEGMRLSHFIRGAFKGLKHHYFRNQQLISPLLKFLEEKINLNFENWVREPFARPFLEHEIGGDGQPTVAHARHHVEEDGVDGILHIYPFKCMPEGIAKDALIEMSHIYGIKTLHLSFDKEIEIERLKTEMGTFATLLYQDVGQRRNTADDYVIQEINRRKKIGKTIDRMYNNGKKRRSVEFISQLSKDS